MSEETVQDDGGNKWVVSTRLDRVDILLVQPVDDREEPRRIHLEVSAADARALGDALTRASDQAGGG